MRALITGGAGFIGRHTTDSLLAAGHAVRVLDCFDEQVHGTRPAPLSPDIEVLTGDVRDADDVDRALRGVDAVLHLAALTGVGQSMYDVRSYTDVNVTGTANLLERILKSSADLQRIVLSSSRAVYGEGAALCPSCGVVAPLPRDRDLLEAGDFAVRCPNCARLPAVTPTTESHPLTPLSVYGHTKRMQEDLCTHVGASHGLPTTVLRYFNVYGAGQSLVNPYTGIVSIFFSRIVHGRPVAAYERGLPVRDFVHVSDVVQANVAALTLPDDPLAVYNVGTGQTSSVAEVAQAIAAASNRDVTIETNDQYRLGDIFACIAATGRLSDRLGVRAKVSLADGLAHFVDWARDQEAVDGYDAMVAELRSYGLMERDATE